MGERPKVPSDADPEYAKLIVDCWHSGKSLKLLNTK